MNNYDLQLCGTTEQTTLDLANTVKQETSTHSGLTLSSLTVHCHLHPLQAANCCRNSPLVVDEDDLMWFKN